MDILLDGISYPSESIADKKKMTQKPSKNAPIELVSEFLLKVNAGEIKEAQVLCNAILKVFLNPFMYKYLYHSLTFTLY